MRRKKDSVRRTGAKAFSGGVRTVAGVRDAIEASWIEPTSTSDSKAEYRDRFEGSELSEYSCGGDRSARSRDCVSKSGNCHVADAGRCRPASCESSPYGLPKCAMEPCGVGTGPPRMGSGGETSSKGSSVSSLSQLSRLPADLHWLGLEGTCQEGGLSSSPSMSRRESNIAASDDRSLEGPPARTGA